jgi:glycosyltransferase involved in cell wall biosynthesis
MAKVKSNKASKGVIEADKFKESPLVSVVIPVYNEKAILFGSIVELVDRMKEFDFNYEILVCENGSNDGTKEIGLALERKFPHVRMLNSPEPNYGAAMRMGILEARGKFVVCDEIDLLDVGFYRRALEALVFDQADLVVGSKLHRQSKDDRPFTRHVASLTITLMLRIALGFKGTDTHGLKAFNRERLLPVVGHCIVDKDLFASEFVIRAEREEYRLLELPVEIVEKRTPSINLVKRVPNVLGNLFKLFVAIRIKG